MSKIEFNENDPADDIMIIKKRLWDLAREQRDKGNLAMYYVLEDLHERVQEMISKLKHGTGEQNNV